MEKLKKYILKKEVFWLNFKNTSNQKFKIEYKKV